MPGINHSAALQRAARCLLACTVLEAQAALDPDLISGLAARTLGPATVSGRITAIDAVHADPNHIVIGAASGGVWISDNGGLTWTPVFDQQPVASIGSVAIDQRNPDVIWVGTGEGNVRNSTSIGAGVFKSIDRGRTWRQMGLSATERINRITLHPNDPDIAYVGAMGRLWGENPERGIYKTTDGGETWERILYVDERSGGTDVKLDPFNPEKVYASLWQFRRWPYFFKSGGPGSGMYVSWDGGRNWTRKTEDDGLPAGELGRISFAPSPARPGLVYALVEAAISALVRSDDGGETWARVNESFDIMRRPFYYSLIVADPVNPERVYNVFENVAISIDGGTTFNNNALVTCCEPGNYIHIDNHALWVNRADADHLILGNDGGIAISRDQGATWRFVTNLPLSQFYHVAVDNDHPYHVYGGLQDNGSWRGPAEVWENGGIRNLHWHEVAFGDGFDTLPDPQNSRRGYVMSQGGFLYRWNLDTGELRIIRPDPQPPTADLRFNWNSGLAQDPFDPATIYYGSQFLHKSSDRGDSWTVISPDLTSNNPEVQTFRQSGGLTSDVTSAENYTTIIAIAPSPLEQGLLWVGTDDGRVHITRNGGEQWTRIDERVRGVNPGAWVPMISASPHQAGTAFVVFDDHRRSDMQPYLYRVDNYGGRWTSLATDNIEGYALSVLQDPVEPNLLFLGTEFGLWFSIDAGVSWTRFTAGVPTVSVMDMAIQARESDLVLGTHGRSIYVIDDYSALRGLSADDFNARLEILATSPGQQYDPVQTPSTRFTGSGEFRADNEPYGVLVTFMASGDDLPHPDEERERERKERRRQAQSNETQGDETEGIETGEAKDEPVKEPKVSVTVTDAAGETIRTFTAPLKQGLNRLSWDLSHDGLRPPPGPTPPEPDADLPPGPEVPPGEYRLNLKLEEGDERTEAAASVTVLADPRIDIAAGDREANYRSQLALQKLQEIAITAVERIVGAREDLTAVDRLLAQQDDPEAEPAASLKTRSTELQKRLDEFEERFRVPPGTRGYVYDEDKVVTRIGMAQAYVGSSFDRQTSTAATYIELAEESLDAAIAELNAFLAGELNEFREAVVAADIGLLAGARPVSR